jgi:small subunit ribosomal protein S9
MPDKKNLSDLKSAVAEKAADKKDVIASIAAANNTAPKEPAKPQIDEKGRAYGTGRRKDAVARVWITRGSGKITVNERDIVQYFARGTQRLVIQQAFEISNRVGQFDVICFVKGGGLTGQAGAVRHGITRALMHFEPALRDPLKKAGFVTRDSRKVERKKYGKHKARRSTQWVKR